MNSSLGKIPFNRAHFSGTESIYVNQALESGHVSGDGFFTKRCQTLLQEIIGAPKALLTTSCTDALEMSALLLNLKPGDEVIMPSFTFVSTANAFVLHGAKPVFADIRPDTLNIDEKQVRSLITRRTRAICVVHYAGVSCQMDRLSAIARDHGLTLIEDNAHGLFGSFQGKPLGSFGQLSTLSFHETKNITSGEGGALIVNDASLIERAEILREKGTNRSKFFRGEVDKYTWVDRGSSYLPSDINAAVLLAQLERRNEIQAKRRMIWNRYENDLRDWGQKNEVQLPTVPMDCLQAYHMFYMILPSLSDRQRLISHLKALGISAVFHYLPLHDSPAARALDLKYRPCPVTSDISERILRLPFFYGLQPSEQDRVIMAIKEFACNSTSLNSHRHQEFIEHCYSLESLSRTSHTAGVIPPSSVAMTEEGTLR